MNNKRLGVFSCVTEDKMNKNYSQTTFVLALIVIASVCLSCTFLKDKFVRDPNAISTTVNTVEIQQFDRNAPLVSPGAEVVRRLALLDPNLARFGPNIEAVERAAMEKSIADAAGKPETIKKAEKSSFVLPSKHWMGFGNSDSAAALMLFQGAAVDSPADRARAASLLGAMVSGLKQIFTEGHTQATGAGGVKSTKTETKDGTTTTMGAELDFQNDGSSTFGMELKTESEKDGAKLVTEFKGRVEGLDCPNAEGQVPITAKLRLGGESGGVGYTQEIEAFIRASVDDDANIVTTTIDIVQGTREIVKGNDIYIETGFTVEYAGKAFSDDYDTTNWRLIRHSQSAASDIAKTKSIAENGQQSALTMAQTILAIAMYKWQSGGCIKIDAASPGSVAVNSTTQIPVKVTHKFEGSDVPSKLEVVLKGEKSVDPTTLARTSGTLTYTAPGEIGKSATIALTANSRRGRATLDLAANTAGQQYTVSEISGPVTFSGQICSLDKPFVIDGTFADGSETQSFTPGSSTGGTVAEAGNLGVCTQAGGGTYNVTLNEQGSGILEFTENITIFCGTFSKTQPITFSVTLKPASGLTCP